MAVKHCQGALTANRERQPRLMEVSANGLYDTQPMPHPRIYIIAGSNGAGKTTFATQFLPRYAGTIDFINADLIAKGLSPFDVDRAATAAGRIALQRFSELAAARQSFAIETTLSARAYAPRLRELKAQGYELHLFFLWIPSPAFAIRRIRYRVRLGGHNVPPEVVRRRYSRILENLFDVYWPLADRGRIINNAGRAPLLIAEKTGQSVVVFDRSLYNLIYDRSGKEKEA